ncbi:hypothetical protein L1049_008906 [Liquidambar formosana]|uniref:HAT C-terminal dimerisation domain-containing protein n=1 Tax=Liquidambar formosana TaxID=63359 RepID=A0AAP0S497_LIQFO
MLDVYYCVCKFIYVKEIYNHQNVLNFVFVARGWYNYGESAPYLQRIAIKVLTQTCSSTGCERNWSTFALIYTKLRNRLAMSKLEELVYVHYNLRLRTRNLTNRYHNDEYYSPIDLNHIFDDEDILDDWIRETEQPTMDDNALEQSVNALANEGDQPTKPYYGSSSHLQRGDASTEVGNNSRLWG